MSSATPPEMFGEIFSYLRNDKPTLKAIRQVCSPWAFLSQEPAFAHLVFKDQQNILEFFDIASTPHSTIPKVLKCDRLCFKDTGTIDDNLLPRICNLMATIKVKHSLAIHVTTGGISPSVHQLSALWKDNIRQLNLSGRGHTAAAFFEFMGSFTRLEALALRNVRMEEQDGAIVQYAFPSTLTQLSLSHSAPFWTFLRRHVLPGGGLAGVKDLYIQELFFGGEAGVVDMRDCFRELNGVHTITLDPVYHATFNNFNCGVYDIYHRSWEATLLQMGGLTHLRINCANLPPKFAMGYVGMYALQFSARLVETVVEIYFPHARESWSSSAYEDFQADLDAMRDSDPSADPTGSSLVVRGLPDALTNGIKAARAVTVLGHPIIFKESDWKEVMGDKLDGL